MKPFWLFVIAVPNLYACSSAQQEQLRAANDAARLLCESAPRVVREAALRGVTVEEVCAMRSILDAFTQEAKEAQEKACDVALPAEGS